MEKIYYVCFESVVNNNLCLEYKEYPKGVMNAVEFDGTRQEFEEKRLRAEARKRLIEKELI